jgi:serine/threonine protein kinase
LGIDLKTSKQVAIKILKVKSTINRNHALECLYKEIKVLTQCDHPHIAKIIEASFDGILRKEHVNNESPKPQESESHKEQEEQPVNTKTRLCYYVMKLAEFGELFRFIEHTDRFSERLSRTLFI